MISTKPGSRQRMSVAARFHKYCKHHGIDVDKKLPYGAITSFMTDHNVWTAIILQGLGARRKGTTLTQAADVRRHGAVVMWCRLCDCCGLIHAHHAHMCMHRRVRLVVRVRVRARVRLLAPARLRLQHCTTRDELQCTKMSCNAMFNVIRMASSM